MSILFQRDPLDTRGPPAGSAVYVHPDQKVAPVAALTLPIGATNTPQAIREIIEPPPDGEDSHLTHRPVCGITISVTWCWSLRAPGVNATSGHFNNFATAIPTNELATFVSTDEQFLGCAGGQNGPAH